MGPVGSEMRVGVPPNKAAKKPTQTAPYSPPRGPTPEATPKARARGNETTAAVTPPKMSPRKLLKRIRLVIDIGASTIAKGQWEILHLVQRRVLQPEVADDTPIKFSSPRLGRYYGCPLNRRNDQIILIFLTLRYYPSHFSPL
jgi:hypothetical protein